MKNIWFEPGIKQTKKLKAEMDRTLARFAAFNGCTTAEKHESSVSIL